MKPCVIAFTSSTYALHGQRLLSEVAIRARLVGLDAERSPRGCAYGLEVDCAQLANCETLLRKYGIAYSLK